MSQPIHTLGRGCDLAPPSSGEQIRKPCDEMPPMRAQFFYCSPLPLDDPLTAVPPPTADSKNIKHLPRPFPKGDNKALLEAWLGMGSKRDRKSHNRTCRPKVGIEPTADKKFGVAGLRPKIKQEVKELKESLKPTRANPETYQPTVISVTQLQQADSETANSHQDQNTEGKAGKPTPESVGCPCKGSHLSCRKRAGRCKCASCPKAPQEVTFEAQTYQPDMSAQQTNDKQPALESIAKSNFREDPKVETTDQFKRSKHWEHNCGKGRSERGRSGKESKLEEDPEPGFSSKQPLANSDCRVENSQESKPIYNRPTESIPADLLKPSKHGRGKSEESKATDPKPECLCIEEVPREENMDQIKRSKHWEHNCKRGRSERARSEKELNPEDNIRAEQTKEKELVKMKSKNKGKAAAAAAADDQNETAQVEETRAWFDQQLKAQMDTDSGSFSRDQHQQTEDPDDSEGFEDQKDDCCAGEIKDDPTSLVSRIPSCCDDNKHGNISKRQQSEAETIFSGSCDQSKLDDLSKRKESDVGTAFSGDCDESKNDNFSERKESEVETTFSGDCDERRNDSFSKRKESEIETVFSGSCSNGNFDSSKVTGASTRIPSCCDESRGNHSSKQDQSESVSRFGSCCDGPHPDGKQVSERQTTEKQNLERPVLKTSSKNVSECCTDLERHAAAIVHKSLHDNDQAQGPTGPPVQIQISTSNDNQFEHSTRPSALKSHSHQHHVQHSSGLPRHIHKSKSNDNQFQHYSGASDGHPYVEPNVGTTSKNSKGRGRFFGRRQADGTAEPDSGLYDDFDGDLPANQEIPDQGDAANDKCICEPLMQSSEPNVLVAGNGNIYTKIVQSAGPGTTGKPFVKLPARGEDPPSQNYATYDEGRSPDSQLAHERDPTEDMEVEGCKAYKHKEHPKCQVDVPVGTSRLHLVTLPSLVVKPIYWSPVNDQYPCIYGTWFYKDTMFPVEPAVANQLEKGYRENECWSQTWDDQLNSAIEVGPEGEEKIVHRLWPKEEESKTSTYDTSKHILSADPHCAARCFQGEAAAEGKVEESDTKPSAATSISKKYPNSQVIYKNCEEAFILKPSLCPSAYYGRRPLAKIKSGVCVGVAVIRGFNRRAWNQLYPSKKSTTFTKAQSKIAKQSNFGNVLDVCPACKAQDEPEKVTDLCLVIHGIGQKLSERMESFNFTYAVNSFRCEMKRELTNSDVKKVLREDFDGVTMVPVNWRATLSFEDGGPRKPGDKERAGCDYSLNDITQPTIPRVRELISDVMLDIPYYMSGHKHKMIAALVAEANRIYRLWCKNNPGFHNNGRVHIISHSLGSVMALEVLSKQPTTLPAELSWRPNTRYFDFQTTNCFLAGSPCAFFLLLESKSLVPRKGIYKPGCEFENGSNKDIFGDAGTFGCLAVDNLYNIMHCNDPIAYRLNACVDAKYGANLKQAEVPDSSRSFMTAVTHAMKSAAGISQNEEIPVGEMPRPATITKMPSQMEMEVHDFTAEEMAEKKFCQLNENGQVDWILGNRPGMLANQYIDMLSAHSSYWNNKDFIRFLCVEIGRKPGKMNTLPNMMARKKSQK